MVNVLGSEFKLFYSEERGERGGKEKSLTSYLNYVASWYQRKKMCGIFNDTGSNHDVLLTSTMVNNYPTFGVCVYVCFHRIKVVVCKYLSQDSPLLSLPFAPVLYSAFSKVLP